MLPSYAPWCGLETYQRGVSDCDKLFWRKWEKTYKIIYMEGQGHIFTVDLIFSGSKCHAEESCIQWTVLFFFFLLFCLNVLFVSFDMVVGAVMLLFASFDVVVDPTHAAICIFWHGSIILSVTMCTFMLLFMTIELFTSCCTAIRNYWCDGKSTYPLLSSGGI